MESPRGLTETVEAIRTLRALGATRVRVGDIEASFVGPVDLAQFDIAPVTAPKLSPEEQAQKAAREYEETLFHSAE